MGRALKPYISDAEGEALTYAPGLLWILLHFRLMQISERHNRLARREAWKRGAAITFEIHDGLAYYSDGSILALVRGAANVIKFAETGSDATQGLEFYKSAAGVVSSSTTQKHTGPRSIYMGLQDGSVPGVLTTPNSVINDTAWRVGWWQYFNSVSTNIYIGAGAVDSSGTPCFSLAVNASKHWQFFDRFGSGSTAGSVTLAASQWYHFEAAASITSTSVNTLKLYVNGTLDATATNITLLGGITGFNWNLFRLATASDDYYLDDVVIDDASTGTMGAVVCTNKRPNANGTLNEWTTQIGAGGSGYGSGHSPQVNEQPLSTTNGWSFQNAALKVEEYTIEGESTGDVNTTGVTYVDFVGWAYAKVGSASSGRIILAGTATAKALTTSYALISVAAGSTTYPSGANAIGMDNNTVNQLFSMAECGVICIYTPASGVSISAALMTASCAMPVSVPKVSVPAALATASGAAPTSTPTIAAPAALMTASGAAPSASLTGMGAAAVTMVASAAMQASTPAVIAPAATMQANAQGYASTPTVSTPGAVMVANAAGLAASLTGMGVQAALMIATALMPASSPSTGLVAAVMQALTSAPTGSVEIRILGALMAATSLMPSAQVNADVAALVVQFLLSAEYLDAFILHAESPDGLSLAAAYGAPDKLLVAED